MIFKRRDDKMLITLINKRQVISFMLTKFQQKYGDV